jgi:hypothetical protein
LQRLGAGGHCQAGHGDEYQAQQAVKDITEKAQECLKYFQANHLLVNEARILASRHRHAERVSTLSSAPREYNRSDAENGDAVWRARLPADRRQRIHRQPLASRKIKIEFARDIRPLLSKRCVCHGAQQQIAACASIRRPALKGAKAGVDILPARAPRAA